VLLALQPGVDSTGGQATVSGSVDFAAIALVCGYRYACRAETLAGFDAAWKRATAHPGPAMIHLKIAPGSMDKLGRPTVGPAEVAQRFKAFLAEAIP
jgi:phosphonopyruvate decarboxylase